MNIFQVELRHAQTKKTTTNKTKIIQDYLCGIVYKNKHASPKRDAKQRGTVSQTLLVD